MRLGLVPRFDGPPPLWPPLLATRGPGATSAFHAHHAIHLIVAVEGQLRFRAGAGAGGRWQSAPGVITAPDRPHSVDSEGVEVLLVFLDPESELGAALGARMRGAVHALDDTQRRALLRDADPMALMGPAGAAWVARASMLLGAAADTEPGGGVGNKQATAAPRTMHPAVRRTLRHLRNVEPGESVTLEGLAEQAGLSPGRLMHAFTESVGIPLRPYLTWLKLQRAAAGIVGGAPLAEAAHAAGFADAAHMSRTFRRMFGMTPSAMRPRS